MQGWEREIDTLSVTLGEICTCRYASTPATGWLVPKHSGVGTARMNKIKKQTKREAWVTKVKQAQKKKSRQQSQPN